jgi:hypothetical protein
MMAPPFKNGGMLGVVNNPSTIILFKNYSSGMAHSLTRLEKIKPPFKNGGNLRLRRFYTIIT